MNENRSLSCERAEELVSVLYGEASERESRDFELHLKQCGNCRAEFAAFATVRESIGECRDEALTGFVSSQASLPVAVSTRKSAIAALRQFFDLSPLWLKGVVGFAAVVFCVLATLAVMRPNAEIPAVATIDSDRVYTQEEVDRAVQQALANHPRLVPPKPTIVESSPPNNPTVAKRARQTEAQRPFSRAEREQLAADLRLLSSDDDLDLEPLYDRN